MERQANRAASPPFRGRPTLRPIAVLRICFGLLLLLAPRSVLGIGRASHVNRWLLGYCRILGARHLIEALWLVRHPWWTRAGATVDGLHAASAVAIALARPERRRMACLNALTAGAFAIEGAREAPRAGMPDEGRHQ